MLEELERAHRFRWTHSDEMLARILEKLDALLIFTQLAWGDPKKRPARVPQPHHYPRPAPPKKQRPSTLDEIRRFFSR